MDGSEDHQALAETAARELAERTGVAAHDVAVVLGSGWRPAADQLGEASAEVPMAELAGFAAPTVMGHGGAIRSVAVGSRQVLVMLGRTHLYEARGVPSVVHGVRTAAFVAFGVADVAGLVLVAATGRWWLIAVGMVCVAAAWFYTGGKRPYGYAGFGEAAVFLFFGPVAVLGTLYVQTGRLTWLGVGGAVAAGAFSAAVLVANNLRDVPTDREAGKVTLAVRLGEARTRTLYCGLVAVPFAVTVIMAFGKPLVLIGFLAAWLVVPAVRTVIRGSTGMALIPVLRDTAFAMLLWGATAAVALAV